MLIIKNFKKILNSLISYTISDTDKITDFSVGSAIRTLYTAFALQLEEFYHAMFENIKYMIENSLYVAFGFELLEATTAIGHIELTFDKPLIADYKIEKGSLFRSSKVLYRDNEYETIDAMVIPTGSDKALVPIKSVVSGTKGNIPEETIDIKVIQDPRIIKVINPRAISGGSDKETYEKRVQRFKRFISTLTKATRGAIEYAAYSVAGITGVTLEDKKAGIVTVYCHDSQGNLSPELKAKVEEEVDRVRAAGVEVRVRGVDKRGIEVKLELTLKAGRDIAVYTNLVRLYITNWINTLPVGYTLTRAELYQVIMNSYDDSIVNVELQDPEEDITGTNNSVIIVTNITVGGKHA